MESDVMVSICCTTYNQERFIREAVDSFLMQKTNFKFEILIHDDASTDGTTRILKRYACNYSDLIRLIIQKENKWKAGMMSGELFGYEPFSYLFSIAKGKYLALCEGDDYWTDPKKLQKQVDFMENHPEHSMSYHRTDMLFEDGKKQPFNPYGKGNRSFTAKELIATPTGIATASKMLRNYYNEETKQDYLDFSGDCLLTTYYGIYGSCGFIEDIKPSVYRIHKGGVWSGKSYAQQSVLYWNMLDKLYELFLKKGNPEHIEIRKNLLTHLNTFGVIIPTFRRSDGKTPYYLKRCLDSVFAQTMPGFMIYVIGDNYDDPEEFEEILSSYPKNGKLYYENRPNAPEREKYCDQSDREKLWCSGGVSATNYALERAILDGIKYVCYLDHDDYWKPDHVETLNSYIDKTEAVWLCTKASIDKTNNLFFPRNIANGAFVPFLPAPGGCIKSSVCYNIRKLPLKLRDVFEETGQVVPADADLWRRCSDYIQEHNMESYCIGKHTCVHDDEGYVRLGKHKCTVYDDEQKKIKEQEIISLQKKAEEENQRRWINETKERLEKAAELNVDELVTGVVVCYNTKDLIQRAYESVRKFHPYMKIIIIDGSDKDNDCYSYVCKLAGEKTRVFHAAENIGHGLGLAVGLSYVTTPYALIFDSDIEMLKSPVYDMLRMMEEDTYGVGYVEKTAFDGHEWGSKPIHQKQGWMRYLHPYFCLIQLKEYKKYEPFIHHGAPAVNTCLDIHKRGLGNRVIKEFPGLGHSSGKGWVWEGKPREYIRHDTRGTREYRVRNGLEEIEGTWDAVIPV